MAGREMYVALWVWPFAHAPGRLRDLAPPGSVGRWVVTVPKVLDGPDLGWIRGMGAKVTRHPTGEDVCYIVTD